MSTDGFTFSATPPKGASDYFAQKSLRPAFRWTEVWGQEHAYAFTVAKATSLDVLSAIKESLQKAIDDGVPYETWAKALKPELEKLGWWGVKDMVDPATGEERQVQLGSPRRLKTIYDANLRTARAAGQWERAQRTKAVLPYFVYQLGPSIHHRPEHEAREGFVAPVNDPVWNAWYPPNGWGCKCWLQQITRTKATALGGPSDTGSGELATRPFRRFRDDASAETVQVPKGIDPGWATNPGKARAETLMTALAEKLEAAGPDVARAAMADLWKGDTPYVLPQLPARAFAPVAVAPATVKAAIGASADVVMVGSGEISAKVRKHGAGKRPMTAADFGRVQAILDRGESYAAQGRRVYMLRMDDGWWTAVLKTAKDGRELILASLYPSGERRAARKLGKG